eukprot:g58993.t1
MEEVSAFASATSPSTPRRQEDKQPLLPNPKKHSFMDSNSQDYQSSPDMLMSRKKPKELLARLSRPLREFYTEQNERIDLLVGAMRPEPEEALGEDAFSCAINLSFACNVCLFVLKIFAAIWSLSLAVVASAVDSFLDLLSGSIIFITSIAMRKFEPLRYPYGKQKMEPLGIMVFAAVMGVASLQLIMEAITVLVTGFRGQDLPNLNVDARKESQTVEALKQDHFNDVITNSLGLSFALLSEYERPFWFMDALFAGLFGMYIVYNWCGTGLEQVGYLVGEKAPDNFIAQVIYVSMRHDTRILKVDTVLCYCYGFKFICEVHIVLPDQMVLRELHDIGESLEKRLELLPMVERALVHHDFEFTHKPEYLRHQKKHYNNNGTSKPASPSKNQTPSLEVDGPLFPSLLHQPSSPVAPDRPDQISPADFKHQAQIV